MLVLLSAPGLTGPLSCFCLQNGAFGEVFTAWLRSASGGDERACAGKTLKPGAPFEERQDFLGEMNLMKEIGAHPNVIGIIGHCLKGEMGLRSTRCDPRAVVSDELHGLISLACSSYSPSFPLTILCLRSTLHPLG